MHIIVNNTSKYSKNKMAKIKKLSLPKRKIEKHIQFTLFNGNKKLHLKIIMRMIKKNNTG